MMACSQCGADLPESAKYCPECGTAVASAEEPERRAPSAQPTEPLRFFQPALVGGTLLGVLSSLPILSLGNALCCMWVMLGGAVSTRLLLLQKPGVTYGDGAFGGVLSGLVGSVVATMFSIPMRILTPSGESQRAVEDMLERFPQTSPVVRDLMLRLASPEISFLTVSFTFLSNLMVFALFAMIGGILAVEFSKRRTKKGQTGL